MQGISQAEYMYRRVVRVVRRSLCLWSLEQSLQWSKPARRADPDRHNLSLHLLGSEAIALNRTRPSATAIERRYEQHRGSYLCLGNPSRVFSRCFWYVLVFYFLCNTTECKRAREPSLKQSIVSLLDIAVKHFGQFKKVLRISVRKHASSVPASNIQSSRNWFDTCVFHSEHSANEP